MRRWKNHGMQRVYIQSVESAIGFYHRFLSARMDYSTMSYNGAEFWANLNTYGELTDEQKKAQTTYADQFRDRQEEVTAKLAALPSGRYEMNYPGDGSAPWNWARIANGTMSMTRCMFIEQSPPQLSSID